MFSMRVIVDTYSTHTSRSNNVAGRSVALDYDVWRFSAVSEGGQRFVIVATRPKVSTLTRGGRVTARGEWDFETEQGLPVVRVEKGVYTIPLLGDVRLTGDDNAI